MENFTSFILISRDIAACRSCQIMEQSSVMTHNIWWHKKFHAGKNSSRSNVTSLYRLFKSSDSAVQQRFRLFLDIISPASSASQIRNPQRIICAYFNDAAVNCVIHKDRFFSGVLLQTRTKVWKEERKDWYRQITLPLEENHGSLITSSSNLDSAVQARSVAHSRSSSGKGKWVENFRVESAGRRTERTLKQTKGGFVQRPLPIKSETIILRAQLWTRRPKCRDAEYRKSKKKHN